MEEQNFYTICCYTEKSWCNIHHELTHDGCDDECIPERSVECCDEKEHSPTRGVYKLTENEVENLKNHPDIKSINVDYSRYKEQFKPAAKEVYATDYRYTNPSKQYRNFIDQLPETPDSTDINRGGYQLLRCVQRTDPWVGIGSTAIISDRVEYTLDGTDVDVVIGDDGCWFGHPEFQNNTGNGPTNYVGGNVLPGNGTCDILDLVLDSPYYIDPEWFDASPGTRLMTRWDGTIVPVESVARAWWTNSSQRSLAFSGIGTVLVDDWYTRSQNNGDNDTVSKVGDHGTACAGATYGRTQGWAFNANKWFVNILDAGFLDIEPYFDMLKLFHLHKPINSKYGNRNPTVSSNSWGYRSSSHRPPANGTTYYYYYNTGESNAGIAYTSTTLPGFMKWLGYYGDGYRMSGEHLPNSMITAGEEMLDSGVIFVASAGNSNQKQVNSGHRDYNNYWATSNGQPLGISTHSEFGLVAYNTVNRRGWPGHVGVTSDGSYPIIYVGALDDDYGSDGKERKVDYSNMGSAVDIYAPADGILTANRGYPSQGVRPDTYSGLGLVALGQYGVATSTEFMSGDSLEITGPNTGYRITTNISNNVSISTITNSILGAVSLASSTTPNIGHPTYGANDDGFWDIILPWSINFGSNTTTNVYVNTNSYVLFGSRSTNASYDESIFWYYNEASPSYPKIFISTVDGSAQRIYYGTEGSSPNRTYRIRFEGHINYFGGVLGSPTLEWEMIFYENNPSQIDLQIGTNQRIGPPSDTNFSGTSAACPVAAGLIATIMQKHREWDWKKLKKYLSTSILTQNSTRQFYQGNESRYANDPNWDDVNSLEGGRSRVIYNVETNF